MARKGFWVFQRRMLDDDLWKSPNTGRVWLYLMNEATHKPISAIYSGRERVLRPGQALVRRADMVKKLRLSPSSVVRSLASLAASDADMKIEWESDGVNYLVTMACWASSQARTETHKTSCDSACVPDSSEARLSCVSLHTNNKENKEREGDARTEKDQNPPSSKAASPPQSNPSEDPDPIPGVPVARGWDWPAVEALHVRITADDDSGAFDYTLAEWRAAWTNLMASRCPATGYPKIGKSRLATDPLMALSDQCLFLRRVRPESRPANGSTAPIQPRPREQWQIERDLRSQWDALKAHPGNPTAGVASPSEGEISDFREKRGRLEKQAREIGVKL